jgi:hypothetical protein
VTTSKLTLAEQPKGVFAFYPIDPRWPDQEWVHAGCSPGIRIGDMAPDDDTPGRWMARPLGDDAFTPGFRTRMDAVNWLMEKAT